MPLVVWFRNDLRLHDHEPLTEALQDADAVIPVYCFDPRHFGQGMFGFPKCGSLRGRFLIESVANLRENLRARGSDLVIRRGRPEDELAKLAEAFDPIAVYAHREVTEEEVAVEEALMERMEYLGVRVEWFWGHTLYHPDDTPYADDPGAVPDVFTSFRKQLEQHHEIRPTRPAPETMPSLPGDLDPGELPTCAVLGLPEPEADPRGVLEFTGGETAGIERLRTYAWEHDALRHYKETRNGLLGTDSSSKVSPWLAHGCLSPRFIHEEVQAYEAERVKNESTYWLIFELLWRDFFRFGAMKYGADLFKPHGPMRRSVGWRDDPEAVARWTTATTGFPFLDANLRELNRTGFMSNRGRQNVAGFFTKNLGLDWRIGAAYFEATLIDYDVTSNWGNWAYVAGVGNDPRDRYFNIVSQAERYDPEGAFMHHWLPELARVPGKLLPHLHTVTRHELEGYGVTLGETYPAPMIDLEASYERLRENR